MTPTFQSAHLDDQSSGKQSSGQSEPAGSSAGTPLRVTVDAEEWEHYLASWRRHLVARNVSETTIKTYVKSYEALMRWAVVNGVDSPEACTTETLESFAGWKKQQPGRAHGTTTSDAHMSKLHRELRVFFKWLENVEDIPSPMAKMPQPKVPVKAVNGFSDDELRALLAACKGKGFVERRDTAIIRLFFDTGIRLDEMTTLTEDKIDLDRDQTVRVFGKGRKERPVAIGAKTIEAIDSYLRVRAKHKDRRLPELWLAGYPHRGALGAAGIAQMLQRRAKLAGVENVHPHRFRHTAAQNWFDEDGDSLHAMRQFGWEDTAMVRRYTRAGEQKRSVKAARRLTRGDRI